MKALNFYIVLILIFAFELGAQELPLINQFVPEDYKAESQNWSISQAQNGFVYAANNKGLLEFKGATWNLYPTPNETIMRSVKTVDDKIFTGFYMDFGCWKRDEYGVLNYTSIVKENNIKLLSDEQFWNIIELDGWMLFQSLERIYIYNLSSKEVKIINSGTSITKMFKVEDTIYFHELDKGISKIEKGTSKLFSEKEYFKENRVVLAFRKEGKLIFLTQNDGFYDVDGKYAFNDKLSNYLENKTVYSASVLKDNSLIIGTISNGAIYCSVDGEIKYKLNQKNGLTNNTVLTTFEDEKGDLWLGLDNGINKIDITSSVRIFNDKEGKFGTVYTSSFHNGYLYLGTNQGLFYKKYPSSNDFTFMPNTQGQVWSLDVIDATLFCGHNKGTFIVRDDKVNLISNIQGTWGVKKIDDNRLLQGNYDGLYLLQKKQDQWELSHKIDGFENSSKFFELYKDNLIFINHEYKGVYKLKIDKDYKKVISIKIDSSLSKGIHSSIIKYQNKIVYAYDDGVYTYADESDAFVKDSVLNKLIEKDNFLSGKLIYDSGSNTLFSFSRENISYLKPDKFSSTEIVTKKGITSNLRKGTIGYENIQRIAKDKYLLGTLNGYIITDLKTDKQPYNLSINSVKYHAVNGDPQHLKLINDDEVELPSKHNSLEFEYSVPYLSKDAPVKYQFILDGYTKNWSSWSYKNTAMFENLPFGNYEFKVRAKVGEQIIDNIPTYSFIIERAWYISNLAILAYATIVFLFSLFMDRLYRRNYRRQREEMLKKQEREFQLKSLENEKELMEIRNTQLKQDVESKNRELAISTMNMIKKNELLSSLKKEIAKNNSDTKNIKSVIKIIDNNLNNEDDWQMFEEAFNNADKDFINKIKSKHENLTPNDLRLCAYLRLNLTSKEIAPLFNISVRSVEIKRYRLRKKLDLPQKSNLIDYMLDI